MRTLRSPEPFLNQRESRTDARNLEYGILMQKPTHAADKACNCCQGKKLVEAVCLSSSPLRFLEASGHRRRKLWSCGTIAAAVGSLMMRRMFMPEMVPASTGLGLQTGLACSL